MLQESKGDGQQIAENSGQKLGCQFGTEDTNLVVMCEELSLIKVLLAHEVSRCGGEGEDVKIAKEIKRGVVRRVVEVIECPPTVKRQRTFKHC